ncbi:MAG TPA: hypothetical protein VH592_14960 [Gemmataceae bacterium]|jgi:hypothetical protein
MDALDSFRATAQEIVSFALQRGIDLEPLRKGFTFQKDRRHVDCWRKDLLPGTGPANEPLGTLHYNLQGAIAVVPDKLKKSASIFRGRWHETGTFESIEQAFELVKAWVIDQKEVDDLPCRSVRSYGI